MQSKQSHRRHEDIIVICLCILASSSISLCIFYHHCDILQKHSPRSALRINFFFCKQFVLFCVAKRNGKYEIQSEIKNSLKSQ